MTTPQFGVAYSMNVALYDTASPGRLKVNPIINAGMVQLSKDYGPLANLATTPAELPAGSSVVRVSLSAAEMQATKLSLKFSDPGLLWGDLHVFLDVPTTTLDLVSGHVTEGILRAVVFPNYPFTMVSSTVPGQFQPGLTVTAQRVRDNESGLTSCDNLVTEVGSGLYRLTLSANDLNAVVTTLVLTAPGALTKMLHLKTSP